MKKQKVVIFGVKYFPSKGGTSRVVENLLWEMNEEFDFTVFCYQNKKAAEHIPHVKTIQFKETPIKGIGVFWYFIKCFFYLFFKMEADIVHVHKTDAAFFLPFLNLRFKTIATSHALPYHNEKWSALGKRYFKIVESIFMKHARVCTAVSSTQIKYYEKKYGRSVKYIPNGIQPIKVAPKESVEALLQKHQVQDDFLLFAARRIIPLKGCHHLITALKKMNYKGSLVVAGDPDQLPEYTKSLVEMAEGIDVKFIGYVAPMEKLNQLIQQAAYFIFPSEIEGMSMMLLEVGSNGTPMICSDIPQNTAVLSEEEVLFFESQNVEDLQQKLEWAMAHPSLMNAMSEKTKKKVESEYLIEGVAQQYAQLYHNFMNSKSKKALVNQL